MPMPEDAVIPISWITYEISCQDFPLHLEYRKVRFCRISDNVSLKESPVLCSLSTLFCIVAR